MTATQVRPRPFIPKEVKKVKRKRGLRRVSLKQAQLNKAYLVLRHQFLIDHRNCQVPECFNHTSQVHHKAGRGKKLLDTAHWLAVCFRCHTWIEGHKNKAREMGLITYR